MSTINDRVVEAFRNICQEGFSVNEDPEGLHWTVKYTKRGQTEVVSHISYSDDNIRYTLLNQYFVPDGQKASLMGT